MSHLASIRSSILIGWLVMVALLLRFEAFPEFFTSTIEGYGGFLDHNIMIEDRWTKLLFKDQPIGYSLSSIVITEGDPKKYYTIKNDVYVRFRALGLDQPIFVSTLANVDALEVLRRFKFSLNSGAYSMQIVGYRIDERRFNVFTTTGTSRQKRVVEIPDDVILYSPMTEMGLRRMKPGQELTIKTLDPASMTPSRLVVRAIRKEPFVHEGQEVQATLLESDYQGATIRSWMGEDGLLLKQETPFGWSMVSCSAEEALVSAGKEGYSGDLLAELAIRCQGHIEDPRAAKGLRLRLTGVAVDPKRLESNRQKVVRADKEGIELLISSSPKPGRLEMRATGDTNLVPYLAATPFVQADHPEMIKRAQKITKGIDDDAEKAQAIFDWVDERVDNVMTISLPSALDVLRTLKGDCNEHTYLFTALARSAGIPAKIIVGVAYHEKAFYYHAWPAVYLGEWVEMDPTWSERAVDATHIKIAEGELANQMELMKFVGQAKIEVLEQL